jgi:hypothetical protein
VEKALGLRGAMQRRAESFHASEPVTIFRS